MVKSELLNHEAGKPQKPAFSDEISTLNENVIDLLVERRKVENDRYPYSRSLDIIHRSIPDDNVNVYLGLRSRGKKISEIVNFVPHTAHFENDRGCNLTIKNIEFPPDKEEIMKYLDILDSRLKWDSMSEREVLEAAAFFCLMTSSTHPYPDGSGRVSVGGAKLLIDQHTERSLDLRKLEEHNKALVEMMAMGTMIQLPEKVNPYKLLDEMSDGESREIDLFEIRQRRQNTNKITTLFIETSDNLEGLGISIVDNIVSYEVDPNDYRNEREQVGIPVPDKSQRMFNRDLQRITESLADLFESVLV